MNLKQRAKTINADYDQLRKSAGNMVERAINIGLSLNIAKEEVAHGEFIPWVEKNLVFDPRQTQKYLRIAVHKVQARAIAASCEEPPTIDQLCKVLPGASEEPTLTSADPDMLAYAGVSAHNRNARDSDDWHTPGEYVDDAREVMGSIDLDPFSTPEANEYIRAARILTPAEDALVAPWSSPSTRTVWMNPPYGRGIMQKAIHRFLDQYDSGAFEQAVVLTNAATDTYWYHDMLKASDALCQTLGRIAFISGDKELSGNTKGQAFFYFGPANHTKRFLTCFAKHGWATSTQGYTHA